MSDALARIRAFDGEGLPQELPQDDFMAALVAALASAEVELRTAALRVVEEVVAKVDYYMTDPPGGDLSMWVHGVARQVIARVDLIAARLADDVIEIRAFAAKIASELARMVHSDWYAVGEHIGLTLALVKQQLANPLAELAAEPDPRTLAPALRALGYLEPGGSRLRAALGNQDEQVRLAAVEALTSFDKLAHAELVALLADPAGSVRAAAVRGLREASDLAPLLPLVEDPVPDVRLATIEALATIGAAGVDLPIARRLADSSGEVRVAAARILPGLARELRPGGRADRDMWTAEIVPALIAALDDRALRLDAAAALAECEDPRAVPRLVALLDEDIDAGTFDHVVAALSWTGDPRAVPALQRLYRDAEDSEPRSWRPTVVRRVWREALRRNLVTALARCGAPQSITLVRRWLASRDVYHQRVATGVLGDVGTAADVPRLRELLDHEDLHVRAGAARSIARLEPAAAGEAALLDKLLEPLELRDIQAFHVSNYFQPAAVGLQALAKVDAHIGPRVRAALRTAIETVRQVSTETSYAHEHRADVRRFLAIAQACLDLWQDHP